MRNRWAAAGTEPSLAEILSDPILHQVMRRDRLSLESVRAAIRAGQDALRRRAERAVDPAGSSSAESSKDSGQAVVAA